MDGISNFSPADLKALIGQDATSSTGFGGMGIWLILLILLLGGRGGLFGNAAGTDATAAAVAAAANNRDDALDFETFEKINDLATQNVQNFMGLGNQVTTSQFAVQQEINGVRTALAECCCQNQVAMLGMEQRLGDKLFTYLDGIEEQIDGFQSDMDKTLCDMTHQNDMNTRDITDAVAASTNTIIGFLTQSKIDDLTAANNDLKLQINQANQTANIIDVIKSCPCGVVKDKA